MRWTPGIGMIALLAAPSSAESQSASALIPGSRIRVTQLGAATKDSQPGTVVRLGIDTLVVDVDSAGRRELALTAISRLEVRATRRNTKKGATIGMFAGGGALGLWNLVSTESSSAGLAGVAGAFMGGIAGAGVGAIIGATHPTERWEEVPASRWRVQAAPGCSGGFALAISIGY